MSKVWKTFIVSIQTQFLIFLICAFNSNLKTMAALGSYQISETILDSFSSSCWIMFSTALWGLYFLNFVPEETQALIGDLGSIKSINAEMRFICSPGLSNTTFLLIFNFCNNENPLSFSVLECFQMYIVWCLRFSHLYFKQSICIKRK